MVLYISNTRLKTQYQTQLSTNTQPKRDSAFEQKTRIVSSREIWGCSQNRFFSYNQRNKPSRAQKKFAWNLLKKTFVPFLENGHRLKLCNLQSFSFWLFHSGEARVNMEFAEKKCILGQFITDLICPTVFFQKTCQAVKAFERKKNPNFYLQA